ncbi:MAG: hypothetical protein R3199_11125, partial [Gemmatimonadota bacterium]|nr:hypothetical protein [Gemmatimonadota bacterium]
LLPPLAIGGGSPAAAPVRAGARTAPDPGGGTVAPPPPPAPDATAEPEEPTEEGEGEPAATDTTEVPGAPPPSRTWAPAPPGGYAVDSRPADQGRLARIEYASPKTVSEVAEFYDRQIDAARRVEIEAAGRTVVAWGLSAGTTLEEGSDAGDVERLLEQRSEPMVVVSPWTVSADDPLVRELRDAGQEEQAEALLDTESRVTVVYAVR